jgi:carboxypeptidase PM20D1
MPGGLNGATRSFFERVAPELGFPLRSVFANLWLFGPLMERVLSGRPALDAMLRTTTAVTMVSGGVKENVLPSLATATVNFRILPGDSIAGVVEHVRRTIDDPRITLATGVHSPPSEPTPDAPLDESYQRIARTVDEVFPGIPPLPFLVIGATDARHYAGVTPRLFRLAPFRFGIEDIERIHGTNERLAVESFADGVRFYRRLIENAGAAQSPSE